MRYKRESRERSTPYEIAKSKYTRARYICRAELIKRRWFEKPRCDRILFFLFFLFFFFFCLFLWNPGSTRTRRCAVSRTRTMGAYLKLTSRTPDVKAFELSPRSTYIRPFLFSFFFPCFLLFLPSFIANVVETIDEREEGWRIRYRRSSSSIKYRFSFSFEQARRHRNAFLGVLIFPPSVSFMPMIMIMLLLFFN